MSFDDEPDDDGYGWYEPDEDEPDDDNWHWYDDPVWVKEEPDCGACNDNGCRSCEPSRLDVLGWRVRSWLRSLWDKLRRRRNRVPVDDPWGSAPSTTPPASPGGFTGEPPF